MMTHKSLNPSIKATDKSVKDNYDDNNLLMDIQYKNVNCG